MGQNQSDQQASIRAVTGTAWTYEGDWHALFDQAGIASGDYNGRLLAWINSTLGTSYTELNGAMNAFAVSQSAPSWNEMGTFSPSSAIAKWDASTSTLAQLAALVTHSRTSGAMGFDSTGKLTYAPNNLLLQSNTFSNAAWTSLSTTVTSGFSDPVGGTAAWRLQGTSNPWSHYQTLTLSTTTLETFWVKSNTGGNQTFRLVAGAVSADLTATTSWQRFTLISTSTGSQAVGITRDSFGNTADLLIYAPTFSAVTYETTPRTADQVITTSSAYYGPRIDYDPNTLAVKGLLIEAEPRTNLQPVSDLSASTTLNAATVATGQAAPDGTTGARKIIADVTAGFHYATQPLATTSGVLYSTSFFAYAPDAGYTLVGGASNTGTIGTFDLATGTATSGTNMAASMRQVGTLAGKPVYKCVWQWTAAANNNQAYFYAPNASNTIAALAGNGTSGVVIWGVQTEAGAKDTSLIITSGAAATRAADIVTLKGPALTAASGSAATLISEWDAINASFSVSNPSMFVANAGYPLLRANNATTLAANSAAGNSQTLTVSGGTFSANYRVGVAYSASGFSLGANGATATSASAFTSPSTVYVGGSNGAANLTGNNHLRSIAIYNQRLPDATLQAKSVVGASF